MVVLKVSIIVAPHVADDEPTARVVNGGGFPGLPSLQALLRLTARRCLKLTVSIPDVYTTFDILVPSDISGARL